jgi:hypothetical protein
MQVKNALLFPAKASDIRSGAFVFLSGTLNAERKCSFTLQAASCKQIQNTTER